MWGTPSCQQCKFEVDQPYGKSLHSYLDFIGWGAHMLLQDLLSKCNSLQLCTCGMTVTVLLWKQHCKSALLEDCTCRQHVHVVNIPFAFVNCTICNLYQKLSYCTRPLTEWALTFAAQEHKKIHPDKHVSHPHAKLLQYKRLKVKCTAKNMTMILPLTLMTTNFGTYKSSQSLH